MSFVPQLKDNTQQVAFIHHFFRSPCFCRHFSCPLLPPGTKVKRTERSSRLEEADWTAQARGGSEGMRKREKRLHQTRGKAAVPEAEECRPGCWDEDKQGTGR
ncbi:hypothetical protein CRENBAI_021164 [Crenichthys baileyi]|uniref:Uncharacterized protein n=1 Tax=Crenichthys baileyi TaxID=28760 RepID=A0AAV9SNW2_9TELE